MLALSCVHLECLDAIFLHQTSIDISPIFGKFLSFLLFQSRVSYFDIFLNNLSVLDMLFLSSHLSLQFKYMFFHILITHMHSSVCIVDWLYHELTTPDPSCVDSESLVEHCTNITKGSMVQIQAN